MLLGGADACTVPWDGLQLCSEWGAQSAERGAPLWPHKSDSVELKGVILWFSRVA